MGTPKMISETSKNINNLKHKIHYLADVTSMEKIWSWTTKTDLVIENKNPTFSEWVSLLTSWSRSNKNSENKVTYLPWNLPKTYDSGNSPIYTDTVGSWHLQTLRIFYNTVTFRKDQRAPIVTTSHNNMIVLLSVCNIHSHSFFVYLHTHLHVPLSQWTENKIDR